MNTVERQPRVKTSPSRALMPDREHGYYNSTTVALDADAIYNFCQDSENLEKVLGDLPLGIENFLKLKLVKSQRTPNGDFELEWKNQKDSKFQGTLTFLLKKAPANRGTIISAIAEFEKIHWRDEEPSTLMNIFLHRMKCLMETGVLPTTKGQPSGREEISSENKTIH